MNCVSLMVRYLTRLKMSVVCSFFIFHLVNWNGDLNHYSSGGWKSLEGLSLKILKILRFKIYSYIINLPLLVSTFLGPVHRLIFTIMSIVTGNFLLMGQILNWEGYIVHL